MGLQSRFALEEGLLHVAAILPLEAMDCSAKINKWKKKVLAWDEKWGKNQNDINKIQERLQTKWYQHNRERAMCRQLKHKQALMEDFQRLISVIQEQLRIHMRDLAQEEHNLVVVNKALHIYNKLSDQLHLVDSLTQAVPPNIAKFLLQNIPSEDDANLGQTQCSKIKNINASELRQCPANVKQKINEAINIEQKIEVQRKKFTRLNCELIKYNRRYIAAVAKETAKLQKVQQRVKDSWIKLVNMRRRMCDEQADRRGLHAQLLMLAKQCEAAHNYYFPLPGHSTPSTSSSRRPSALSFFTTSIDEDVNKGVKRLKSWLESIQQVRAQLDSLPSSPDHWLPQFKLKRLHRREQKLWLGILGEMHSLSEWTGRLEVEIQNADEHLHVINRIEAVHNKLCKTIAKIVDQRSILVKPSLACPSHPNTTTQ